MNHGGRKCPKMSKLAIEELHRLHGEGLSCKEIAREIGYTDVAVLRRLKKSGLSSNNKSPKRLIIVGDHGVCSGCGTLKHQDYFATCYNGDRPYKRSFCNTCLSGQIQTGRTVQAYLTNRVNQVKHRAKMYGLSFDLDPEWALGTFADMNGKCFYSGDVMSVSQRVGLANRNQLSFDRVDPAHGYLKSNTVLCTYRMNAVKQDLSLEELREWIPRMYERAATFLNDRRQPTFSVALDSVNTLANRA